MAIRLTVMIFHIQTAVVDPRTEIALSTATGVDNKSQRSTLLDITLSSRMQIQQSLEESGLYGIIA